MTLLVSPGAVKPRLIDGLVTVELADALLFEGGPERRVLRGRHAVELMPRLLALLDGTRTLEEVAALSGVATNHVDKALHLLWSLGLIECTNPRQATTADGFDPALRSYIGRLIGTAVGPRDIAAVVRRLARAEVIVIAGELAAQSLARQLDALGIGETSTAGHSVLIARRLEGRNPPDLVVVVEGTLDRRCLGRLDLDCARTGIPWLRTAIHPAGAEIGPLFRPNEAVCHRCFRSQRSAEPTRQLSDSSTLEAWAALVATEVLSILGGIAASASAGLVTVFDFDLWENQGDVVAPGPDCSTCSYPLERR